MTEVILVNLVNLQDYIYDNIKQLLLLNYNVTVIISDNLKDMFKNIENIKIVLTSSINDSNFNSLSKLDDSFRGGFWKLTSARLFYLYNYLKTNNIQHSIHIENDVMLYGKVNIPDLSKVWLTMDSNSRCIPGIIFIPDYISIERLIIDYIFDKNDMENLAIFFNNNRDKCMTFPLIQSNMYYDKQDIFSQNFDSFNCIFDGAAIGQYLGGVDPRNIAGDTRGFVNETCVVDYSRYQFIWRLDSYTNLYKPNIIINEREIPIMNLHIHSKQLNRFSVRNPLEIKLIPIKLDEEFIKLTNIDNYITGERFQSLADVFLGLPEDFQFNPIICQSSKLCDISTITSSYNNPKIVFCYIHRLNILKNILCFFQNPFILLTHNSDEIIDDTYAVLLYSNKLIRWYAQNIQIKHPKLCMLPIGLANKMWEHGNLNIIESIITNFQKKTKNFYFYFEILTNLPVREHCRTEIEKKGLIFGNRCNFSTYIHDLAQYKFAICPPGNGIDCHRIWECYYLGVIPILLRSCFSEQLQESLPCILLDKWSDFNSDEIIPKYNQLIEELNNNRHYLNINYYKETIEKIKPRIVWFYPRGRSGNNLFQYLAAEVIKHIYNYDIVLKTDCISADLIEINDENYTQIINKYMANPQRVFSSNSNLIINGYFQKSNILLYLRPLLLKYFNILNTTPISNNYRVSDFSKLETKHMINFDGTELVLHLRLDDYIHNNSPPNIFSKEDLSKVIDTISFSKLYIICDEVRAEWEKTYIKYFTDKYDATVLTGSLMDDFNFLKISKRLVTSHSTFCWMAAYMGDGNEVFIPYSNFYKDHQILKECHSNCIVYYDIPLASNLDQ